MILLSIGCILSSALVFRTEIYFIDRQLAELPVFILAPFIFTSIFYWMVGFNPAFEAYATAIGLSLLMTQAVTGFGNSALPC